MGMVLTSYRGSTNRRDDGHGRVYAWGQGKKRLRPRKGIEGAQKKFGRPYG